MNRITQVNLCSQGCQKVQKHSPDRKEHGMKELNYALKQLCRHCREGSYATQRNRERILTLAANELHAMGYRKMQAKSLKPKHIEALVKHWQEKDLSIGTIKNRMAALRWWSVKINKQNVMARSNEFYGIPDRRFVTNESKAREISEIQLGKVKDIHVRMSLELQRAFGLRREEAMKFQPSYADQKDHLRLKASWTKGGKPRSIPVRTEVQREMLRRARNLAGFGSLIPPASKLRAATESLRGKCYPGRPVQYARASPCLCAGALRGTDRLAMPGHRRAGPRGPESGTKGTGPPDPADH